MAKAETEFWLLGQDKISRFFFYLLILFLPTQLGKHFLVDFSVVKGLRIDYLSPTLYFTDILILCVIIFSFKSVFKILIKKYRQKLLIFSLLSLSLLLGVYHSLNYQAGLYIFIKLLEYAYLGIYVFLYFKTFDKKLLITLLGIGIVFESLLALAQYFNQGSFQGLFYFLGERAYNGQTPGIANASINGSLILRPYATFPHPNVLAGYLNIALVIVLYFAKNIRKSIKFIIIVLASLGILISFSRIGILVLLGSFVIFFCNTIYEKYKKHNLNPRYLLAVLMVGLFIITVIFFVESNSIFAQRFLSLRLTDETLAQRGLFLEQAVIMISKNPVFGVGLGNYINNLGIGFMSHDQLQPVHNLLFLATAETGLLGLLFFIYLFKKILMNARNIYFLIIIVALCLIGSFDHYLLTLQQGQILLALSISIIMSERV